MDVTKPGHEHADLRFPEGFLWGAATSAHQVEGANIKSDWWEWESFSDRIRSGLAADQYNLYEQDFGLAKSLDHNAHRLSIEWARIEPEEGQFDQNEIEHYLKILKYLKSLNLKVMLTLWHFTLPAWVSKKGGWENGKTVDYFIRFVEKIVPLIKDYVDFWITLNEPGIYVFMAYSGGDEAGCWPPCKKSKFSAIKVFWNLTQAHKKSFKIIHQLIPDAKAGIAQNVQTYEAFHKHSIIEQLSAITADFFSNHNFYWLTSGYHDFLGINYYFHYRLKKEAGFIPKLIDVSQHARDVSDLGWEVNPEGIFDILTDISNHLPIYITECGIASGNDDRRTRFLLSYLQEVYRAIAAGVNVKGFFYWSLIDNFEWHRGFDPKFGLIEVDFKTQKRTIRPSALVYKEIINHNGIAHKLLRLLGHGMDVKKELEKIVK